MTETPLFVADDYLDQPRIRLFSFMGVPFTMTRNAWTALITYYVFGLLTTFVTIRGMGFGERLLWAFVYALLFLLTYIIHDVGHIIGGKMPGHPMTELLITNTRHVNIYENDPPDLDLEVHLSRATGGPLANLGASTIIFIVWAVFGGHVLATLGLLNLLFGVGSFAPVRSVDGAVIWAALGARTHE